MRRRGRGEGRGGDLRAFRDLNIELSLDEHTKRRRREFRV